MYKQGESEIWKDIIGWYGLYRVSTEGRIKSMERIVKLNGKDKLVGARFLKPGIDKDGYLGVQFSKDGKQVNYRIHRIVAMTFIKNPNNYPLINHIDNDVKNNAVWNLEWCTQEMNMQHMINQGRKVITRKISIEDTVTIKRLYQSGLTMQKISEQYNVSRPAI